MVDCFINRFVSDKNKLKSTYQAPYYYARNVSCNYGKNEHRKAIDQRLEHCSLTRGNVWVYYKSHAGGFYNWSITEASFVRILVFVTENGKSEICQFIYFF